jgi:LysM repeat protein
MRVSLFTGVFLKNLSKNQIPYPHYKMVNNMKSIEIKVGNHRAVIRFKKISCKDLSLLRWKLIKQNISAIDSSSIIKTSDKSSSTDNNDEN